MITDSTPSDQRQVRNESVADQLPNFLYVGTSKAGSTWLYAVLSQHPDVYIESGKGLYFFSNHYDRGIDWYLQHFRGAEGKAAIGEMSHNYLYTCEAPARIAALNPQMKILVCVREPVDRAYSDYLHRVRNEQIDVSFDEALDRVPSLIEHGRYHDYLQRYIDQFGRANVHVAVFDELGSTPCVFASRIFKFLEVRDWTLPDQLQQKIMPASEPRVHALAHGARQVARFARRIGLRGAVGRAKRSRSIRGILYREYKNADKPKMSPETRQALRQTFASDVRRLDKLLGTDLERLWRY